MLGKLRTRVNSSGFARNVFLVARANVVGQALMIAIAPLLTRLFTPEEFGIAATGLAAIYLLNSIASWGFDRYIPNMVESDDANILFLLAFLAAALSLSVWFAAAPLVQNLVDNKIVLVNGMLFLVGLSFFARTGVRIAEAWFVRHGDLAWVSGGKVALSLAEAIVSIATGLFGLGATGLMLAYALAPSAGLAYLVRGLSEKKIGQQKSPKINRYLLRSFPKMLHSHGWLALIATASAAVNSFSMTMMVVSLSFIFSAEELGLFALIRRITLLPASLVTTALAQAYWSRAADFARNRDFSALKRSYVKTTGALAGIAMAIAFLCFIGSLVVGPVFGDDWAPASPLFLAMIPYLAGLVMFMPTNILIVFNKQGLQILVDGTRIVLVALVAIAATMFDWELLTTIWLMSTASFVGHLMLFAIHLVLLRHHNLKVVS